MRADPLEERILSRIRLGVHDVHEPAERRSEDRGILTRIHIALLFARDVAV